VSAAELRKAADTVREQANGAVLASGDEAWWSAWWSFTIKAGDVRVAEAHSEELADYIATMDPDVGRALADWLEVEAGYQWTTSTERSNAALTVARLINGGA
jgi:hypothetical protein